MSLVGTVTSTQTGKYFYLISPATGANNIVASASGSQDIQINGTSYTGADQTAPIESSDFTQTASSASSITYTISTVADNCWLHSVARGNLDGTGTAGTGTTDRSSGTRYFSVGDSGAAKTPAGSQSMQWTYPRSQNIFGAILIIKPVGVTATSSISTQLLMGV